MRTIRIIAVGRIKQAAKYLEEGIRLYEKRLSRHVNIEWVEVPEEAPTPTRTVEQVMLREAEAILKYCTDDAVIVLLHEKGRQFSSVEFSQWLFQGNPPVGGRALPASDRMIFIIGGAYGTAPQVREKAGFTLSLSTLTFPHQMVRLILMEQLYRAYTIALGEPYHK